MQVSLIERLILFVLLGLGVFVVYHYEDSRALATCQKNECTEVTETWQNAMFNVDRVWHSNKTAFLLRGPNPLPGEKLKHGTQTVERKHKCTGDCACDNPSVTLLYEGKNYKNCTETSPEPRYFCAKDGKGVKGSWNESNGP